MEDDDRFSLELAEAVLDGRPLDPASLAAAPESQRELVAHFQAVAGIAAFGLTSSNPGALAGLETEEADESPDPLTWGPLTILGRIARGSFGDVYRARDPRLDRPVALKLLRHRDRGHDEAESAAIEEGRLMARVRHPNVVTVYGAERIDGRVGLWMQLVDGKTLEEELIERGPMAEAEVARIGFALCGALAAIHRAGLIHRDLKARNVLRDTDGQVMVADFGAGLSLTDLSTGEVGVTGTPLYLAPDVLEGGPATPRSDIYSLGVLLFHLVTGTYPVTGRTVAEIKAAHREGRRSRLGQARPGLSDRFVRAIERALEVEPNRRFESAAAMGDALAPRSSSSRPFWLAAAVLALAVATAALVIPRGAGEPPPSSVVARRLPLGDWSSVGGPSADGRLFSFVDNSGNVAVLDITSGKTRRLTDDAALEGEIQYAGSPAVSTDGRLVAFSWWTKDGKAEIRVVDVESKQSRVLMRSDAIEVPEPVEWSRDGQSILSILIRPDTTKELALISVTDGTLHTVKDLGTVFPQHASLSPDGEFVIFDYPQEPLASARDILIVRRDGSDERHLVESPATDVAPAWTADGRHVVFSSDRSGSMDLWSIRVEGGFAQGEPDILHRNIGRALLLGVTDLGGYYYHQQVGPVDVFDAQLEPGASRTLTPISATYSGSNISSLWSPDGSQIAFASRRGPVGFTRGWTALAIRDLKTGVQREWMPAMNMFLLRAWSPDGRSILVQGENALGRTGAHAIDTQTGSVSPVVLNGPGQNDIRRPDWRPDGTVAYINNRSKKLLSRDVRSGRERVLVDLGTEGLNVAAHVFGRGYKLSPDGQSLAYTVNGREDNKLTASLWIKPLDGGPAREVAKAPDGELLLFQDWTPDGSALLFTTWIPEPRQPVSLFRVSARGGEAESLRLIREGLRDVSVSPDGTRITFTAGWPRAEIWGLENLLTPDQLDGGSGR